MPLGKTDVELSEHVYKQYSRKNQQAGYVTTIIFVTNKTNCKKYGIEHHNHLDF
jgi:hypothetical protein